MISAQLVKELREKTGAGMMDCKKVLTETDGDMDKAAELLRERGITKAAKKADRIAAEGLVYCYVSDDKKVGVVLEVNAETDFVAKNEEFRKFVASTAKQIAVTNPADVESLLLEKSIEDSSKTVQDILTDKIATIGENMSVRRFTRYETEGLIETYTHGDGKIGVMVDFAKGTSEIAKDVCMQIAAAKPEYVSESEVPQDVELAKNQESKMKAGDNGIFLGMPVTKEETELAKITKDLYTNFPSDGKYVLDGKALVVCQSNATEEQITAVLKPYKKAMLINPLGEWSGGTNVDTGAVNRKLGSDMGRSATGGGLHGKDLTKADVSVNIYAFLKAQKTGAPVELSCAIGDSKIDGKEFSELVEIARDYIKKIGGFEKFAEWGLIRCE